MLVRGGLTPESSSCHSLPRSCHQEQERDRQMGVGTETQKGACDQEAARACFEGTADGRGLCEPGAGTELGGGRGRKSGPCQRREPEGRVREPSGRGASGGAAPTGPEPPPDLGAQGFRAPPQEAWSRSPAGGTGGPRVRERSHLLLKSHGPAAGSSDPPRWRVCSLTAAQPRLERGAWGSRSWLGRSAQHTPRLLGEGGLGGRRVRSPAPTLLRQSTGGWLSLPHNPLGRLDSRAGAGAPLAGGPAIRPARATACTAQTGPSSRSLLRGAVRGALPGLHTGSRGSMGLDGLGPLQAAGGGGVPQGLPL